MQWKITILTSQPEETLKLLSCLRDGRIRHGEPIQVKEWNGGYTIEVTTIKDYITRLTRIFQITKGVKEVR